MFHVEQFLATIAISGIFFSAMASAESAQNTVPAFPFALSTENNESKLATQNALLDLLLGWDESARMSFQEAVAHDTDNALAYAGLCLTNPQEQAYREKLKEIFEVSSTQLLPHESFYIESLLKLAAGHYSVACQDFCKHADRFRRDKVANVWAVILLHSTDIAYHPETGKPSSTQSEAIRRIGELTANFPNDALVAYARAYIEQSAPEVSGDALAAALQSVEAYPNHPMPHLLMGHLLSRVGQHREAVQYFNHAAVLAAKRGLSIEQSPLWWKARLCEATALWSARDTAKANQLIKVLNSSPVHESAKLTETSILRRWECNTLPLRLLVADSRVPTQREITTASNIATPKSSWKSNDYVLHVRDCLRASLSVRLKVQQKKWKEANHSLEIAENARKCLEQAYETLADESPSLITPWWRAHEACSIAVNSAKAALYKDTKQIWLDNAAQARKAPNLMLPPVIPTSSF